MYPASLLKSKSGIMEPSGASETPAFGGAGAATGLGGNPIPDDAKAAKSKAAPAPEIALEDAAGNSEPRSRDSEVGPFELPAVLTDGGPELGAPGALFKDSNSASKSCGAAGADESDPKVVTGTGAALVLGMLAIREEKSTAVDAPPGGMLPTGVVPDPEAIGAKLSSRLRSASKPGLSAIARSTSLPREVAGSVGEPDFRLSPSISELALLPKRSSSRAPSVPPSPADGLWPARG